MQLPDEKILRSYTFEQVQALIRETRQGTVKKKYSLPVKQEIIELNFQQRSLIGKNRNG